MKRKILSAVSAMAVFMSMMPVYASAVDGRKVRVIVENSTLSQENGAAWNGV